MTDNYTLVEQIKQRSDEVFQIIASELNSKAASGKRSFRAWFRKDSAPSAGYMKKNANRPYTLYHDFSGECETLDCIAAWQKHKGIDFKTAINDIAAHLNLDGASFNNWTKTPSKYVFGQGLQIPEIVQIDAMQMAKSCKQKGYEYNPLFVTLCQIFNNEQVTKTFAAYHVGIAQKARHRHHKSGVWCDLYGTVFWYKDICGRVRYANIIAYQNGKRFGIPLQPDEHRDIGLTKCFFGENLLAHPKTSSYIVIIVESEKTALFGTLAMPFVLNEQGEQVQIIFIASGGASALTAEKVQPIVPFLQRANQVILFFDADAAGRKGANAGLENLHHCGVKNASILDKYESRTDGFDFADEVMHNFGNDPQIYKNTPQLTTDTTDTQTPTDTQNEPQSEQNAIVADVLEIIEPDTNDGLLDMEIIGECDVIEMDILLKSSVFKWQVTPIPYELKGDALIDYIVEHCPIPSDLDGVTAGVTADTPKTAVKSEKDTNKRRMYETYIPTKKPNQSTIVF